MKAIKKTDAARKLCAALKTKMGKLRWAARTQFKLDLSSLTDREIVQIIYEACDFYLSDTPRRLETFEFNVTTN